MRTGRRGDYERFEHQHKFVLNAISYSPTCLANPDEDEGVVSLDTVEGRIRIEQTNRPEEARECGIHNLGDRRRLSRIEHILHDMVRVGCLTYHAARRWSVG